jgi:hypothetical protein
MQELRSLHDHPMTAPISQKTVDAILVCFMSHLTGSEVTDVKELRS